MTINLVTDQGTLQMRGAMMLVLERAQGGWMNRARVTSHVIDVVLRGPGSAFEVSPILPTELRRQCRALARPGFF